MDERKPANLSPSVRRELAQENAATAWQRAEAIAQRVAREPADTWEDAQAQAEELAEAWAQAAALCGEAHDEGGDA